MSKTIQIKNGDIVGAFKEIAEVSVLNSVRIEKRICKKCNTSMAKELAKTCCNCRRVFCTAHLLLEPRSGDRGDTTTTFDFYCEPCYRLKYGTK